ncbi:DnaK suppressor protein homolog (modular protein) [Desulfamplus magnetovallimortis]|uniref:DnaK suppressor protein homolog (Modular protein) n=1 Tax=Desulfamplus magnetovallimortis TaxID=1246637 RepID=A0A1W1HIY7_9BACT|nr:hypothetical protein [Desulfamplus magnetovallimortis]SLM32416.1 DnaK suppressor protein homolog (modular protein) [Desulfamplus magnetovallimortis]
MIDKIVKTEYCRTMHVKSDNSESGYFPSENEEYMNERQLHYFKKKLLDQQKELRDKLDIAIRKLKTLKSGSADVIDQSNQENALFMELKNIERCNHLLELNKNALTRIEKGYFGYCMLTGDAIGLKRLNLIPTTTMSIEAMTICEENMGMNSRTSAMGYSMAS